MRASLSSIDRRLSRVELDRSRSPTILKQRLKEVSEIVNKYQDEYNSPEAVAQREADYQEICRIGQLRGEAFRRGEPMDRYPLPWMTREALERQLEELEEDKELYKKLNPNDWEDNYNAIKERLEKDLKERIELDKIYSN